MQASQHHAHPGHFHLELRHATVPTYIVSYIFPVLLLMYEVYRVGSWIAVHGLNFTGFEGMGYEYLLLVAVFGVQLVVEVVFLISAAMTSYRDFQHRLANLLLGMFCSAIVIGADYALQYGIPHTQL